MCAVAGEKKRYSNAGGRFFPHRRLGAARLWEARGPLSTSSGLFLNALPPHPWLLLERSDFFSRGRPSPTRHSHSLRRVSPKKRLAPCLLCPDWSPAPTPPYPKLTSEAGHNVVHSPAAGGVHHPEALPTLDRGGLGGAPGGKNACTQKGLAGIENMICDPWVKYSVNSSTALQDSQLVS